MTSFARMLHPTDFSESSAPALAMAIDMARRQGAELHLLHVSPTFGEDPLHSAYLAALDERRFYKHLQDEADARMVALIERMGAGDLRIKRVHTHGPSTAPMILSYAAEEQVELIVIGTHGRRGLRRFLLGSVAEEVIRGASCDVCAVREGVEPLQVRRLLVPLDLSPTSAAQLDAATRLAGLFGAEIDLLYVLPNTPLPAWGIDADVLYGLMPERKHQAEQELTALAAGLVKTGIVARSTVEEGFAGSIIREAGERLQSDLIVIAPHSRGVIERFFLGSVTEWVIRHSDRAVYLAHAAAGVPAPPSISQS
ncbi:MAG: universal stress protein [Rhodothermales bacterium]|nr:universal stress protein [Rhodothermales bacterium]